MHVLIKKTATKLLDEFLDLFATDCMSSLHGIEYSFYTRNAFPIRTTLRRTSAQSASKDRIYLTKESLKGLVALGLLK